MTDVRALAKELKPCPFCKTVPNVRDQLAEQNDQYFIWCDECLAEGPPERVEEAAIASWNHRAADAREQPITAEEVRAALLVAYPQSTFSKVEEIAAALDRAKQQEQT